MNEVDAGNELRKRLAPDIAIHMTREDAAATTPTLTPEQADECDALQWKIYRLGVALDFRLKDYNDALAAHPTRIARAVDDLNAAIAEADAFRATLGGHEPYRPVRVAVPGPIVLDEANYDAVYYDLDELPRGSMDRV